jgi:hypothetical protein
MARELAQHAGMALHWHLDVNSPTAWGFHMETANGARACFSSSIFELRSLDVTLHATPSGGFVRSNLDVDAPGELAFSELYIQSTFGGEGPQTLQLNGKGNGMIGGKGNGKGKGLGGTPPAEADRDRSRSPH